VLWEWRFQNVPGVTSYESQEVLIFSSKIFCIQQIVITFSHHKYHIIIKFLPGGFQLAIYIMLITYLVRGIILFLIRNEYVWHFVFSKKLRGSLERKMDCVDVTTKNVSKFLTITSSDFFENLSTEESFRKCL